MWHTVFIVLHAAAATTALVAGLVALPAGRAFGLYRWAVAGMGVFLVPAIAISWTESALHARVIFAALLIIIAAMFVRATRAGRMLPATTGGPSGAYLDHVGFGVIALFVAVAVMTALRAGARGWLVAAIGVGAAGAGFAALGYAKACLIPPRRRDGAGGVREPLLPG